MVTLTDVVAALPETVPFVGPEAQERQRGRLFKARIGANENVFGPSPGAIRAMQDAVPSAWQYGDPESHDLREALAAHHDIDMNNLVVGEGIDGLLGYLCRLIVQPGTRVVTSAGAYPTFNYHVQASGGELIPVPYVDDHESPEDLVACAKRVGARLVYLANPDNPMGTWSSGATISSALSRLPSDCLLVLDEAYIDCAPRGAAPEIDTADTRLVRMRTFSKAYGMAGMRTGYAIGHTALIAAFNRVRNHFGMCRVSQAGALAALADQAYLAAVVTRIAAARDRITAIAAAAGSQPSHRQRILLPLTVVGMVHLHNGSSVNCSNAIFLYACPLWHRKTAVSGSPPAPTPCLTCLKRHFPRLWNRQSRTMERSSLKFEIKNMHFSLPHRAVQSFQPWLGLGIVCDKRSI